MVDFKKALVRVKKQKANAGLPLRSGESFYNPARDGITQGLLYTWLECRQAARWYLQGWSSSYSSMAMTYGNVLHAVLEYVYSDIQFGRLKTLPNEKQVKQYVARVEREWRKENKNPDAKSIQHLEFSLLIAEATLPVYFDYWHKDLKEMQWEKVEQSFSIPFTLPDGRKTILRGKMDGVYKKGGRWLFETKSKTRIETNDLIDMLPFELQNMLYCLVLWKQSKQVPRGIRYNIVRRVGLEQKKGESLVKFAKRCVADIRKRPKFYFVRMQIEITEQDLVRFEAELEDMIKDFLDWWEGKGGHYKNPGACINKYGRCRYLNACSKKGMKGYIKRDVVYRELEEK